VLFGPIILAVVIVLLLPVMFLLTGGAIAAIYSYLLPASAEATHEGSELIDLNT
jgi:hypothetical protein